MSETPGEVEFEVVRSGEAPSATIDRPLDTGSSPDPMSALDPGEDDGPGEIEHADVRTFDEGAFPLAGPILEASTGRELKGRCSKCETRLRIRVNGPGAVKVRCPICGHTRRIEI